MTNREKLHEKFVEVLGSRNVYFQPPSTLKIKYPCIIYSLDDTDTKHANDKPYDITKAYSVTLVDEDPDSEIADKLLEWPLCKLTGTYATEGLNHYKFLLYNK